MERLLVTILRGLAPSLFLILACIPASAQEVDAPKSQPINLDKELEDPVTPDRAESYYHYALGKWNEERGDIPKALSEMRAALKYNRTSPAVHLELAVLLEKSDNIQEAIKYAREASRLDPQDPDPHWFLANIYFKQRKPGAGGENMQKALEELEVLKGLIPDDERVYYALGGAYFELGQADKGIQAYEKFQNLAPNTDNGFREIARYHYRNGDLEKAIEYLNRGLKARPDSAESLGMLGMIYSRLSKNKEAVPVYRKLLEVSGNNPNISARLAESLIETGEYEEAYDILESMAQTMPKDGLVRTLKARAQIGRRRYDEAIGLLQSVVAADPQAVEAQFYLATAYEQSGRAAEAVKIYARLLEATPADTDEGRSNRLAFQQRLAANYQELGENEKAIAIYQEMAQSDPRSILALVDAYRLNRQFDKALALGKKQFEKDPADVRMAIVYARTLADAKRGREGAEILSRLLPSNPDNVDIYINLSQLYLQDKKFSEAEKIIRRAEERNPQSADDRERLKFQLATVYERQKDFDRAESLFKEILQANPKNALALNYIGYMLADRGIRLEEALKYVQEALAIDPYNGAYLDSLGWAYFKLNELENAERYLLQAGEIVKNDPIIDEHLGDLYFKTGDLKKAEEFWMRSIRIGTEPEDIQKVRRKLENLLQMRRKQKSQK